MTIWKKKKKSKWWWFFFLSFSSSYGHFAKIHLIRALWIHGNVLFVQVLNHCFNSLLYSHPILISLLAFVSPLQNNTWESVKNNPSLMRKREKKTRWQLVPSSKDSTTYLKGRLERLCTYNGTVNNSLFFDAEVASCKYKERDLLQFPRPHTRRNKTNKKARIFSPHIHLSRLIIGVYYPLPLLTWSKFMSSRKQLEECADVVFSVRWRKEDVGDAVLTN